MALAAAAAVLLLAIAGCPAGGAALGDQLRWGEGARRQEGGLVVPLQMRHHEPSRRRHLLRSGYLPVEGAVREVGYFYTTLTLGTPARTFIVIIDTGSTITYIPCKGCRHCGQHKDEWFDPDSSTTSKWLGCADPLCNCGTPSCTCQENRCYYSRTYAERSSSEGWLIEDAFGFPDGLPPVRLVFGCENGETGEIYRQMADGIMGMGNNHNAFQSQLVKTGIIEDVFSLCFGYPKDGILLLGDVAMPPGVTTVYTPLLANLHLHYYNVHMEGVTVGGVKLPIDRSIFDRGYGVVLDSGTTFTYLPSDAFNAMAKAVGDYAEKRGLQRTPGVDPQYNDICWKGAPDGFRDLDKVFPPAEFVFGGGAVLALTPLRYLFASKPGEYCLGVFDNGMSGTLIGGVSVRDVVVTYDRRNSRVGFTVMPCADVSAALAARANQTRTVASPPPPAPPPPSPPPPPPPTPPKPSAAASGSGTDAQSGGVTGQPGGGAGQQQGIRGAGGGNQTAVGRGKHGANKKNAPATLPLTPQPSASAGAKGTQSGGSTGDKLGSGGGDGAVDAPGVEGQVGKGVGEQHGTVMSEGGGVGGSSPSGTVSASYRATVAPRASSSSSGYSTMIGIFLCLVAVAVVAEVLVFHRPKVAAVLIWMGQRLSPDQRPGDAAERAPLAGAGRRLGGAGGTGSADGKGSSAGAGADEP